MRWDLFCRVIDNHGDVGVCWRLARSLAQCGDSVRLWIDDASALSWMAPSGAHGVDVRSWAMAQRVPEGHASDDSDDQREPADAVGDVVIEAFGCALPDAFVERMAARQPPPVWINLEYLSAQAYVDRNHGLPSPRQHSPGAGLVTWFYYPGFSLASGGLMRQSRDAWVDRTAWPDKVLAVFEPRPAERAVGLFAYAHAKLEPLLDALDVEPTAVLAFQGPSLERVRASFDARGRRGRHLRMVTLPWLDQSEFDDAIAACDFTVVRGEDSLVRAVWSGKPFVWNIYAQDDGAHRSKLDALLDRLLAGCEASLAPAVRAHWHALNGIATPRSDAATAALPLITSALWALWREQTKAWRAGLLERPDLVTALRDFAREKQALAACPETRAAPASDARL